ncbi:hypothetical protein ACU4GD_29140 [Cupriavidus basilensis]
MLRCNAMPNLPLIETKHGAVPGFRRCTLARPRATSGPSCRVEPELGGGRCAPASASGRCPGAGFRAGRSPRLDHFPRAPATARGRRAGGAELRDAGGRRLRQPDPGVPLLLPIPLEALVGAHPGLQLERKSVAVAVHYRAVPHLEGTGTQLRGAGRQWRARHRSLARQDGGGTQAGRHRQGRRHR